MADGPERGARSSARTDSHPDTGAADNTGATGMRNGSSAATESGGAAASTTWTSFLAMGDSFTEGLQDVTEDGGMRGWADRLAAQLATIQPQLRYANLAVRGKLIGQILEKQLPEATRLRADLVAFNAGGNDILRPGTDPDTLAERFDDAVRKLRATGADVLIGTGFDTRGTPVLSAVRGKVGTYNSHLRAIADAHGCYVLDLWSMHVLRDSQAWSDDRLHLSADGHRRVALRACEALGIPVTADWRDPWPPKPELSWSDQRAHDLRWARDYLMPWIGRRLSGRSSGDNRSAKRPTLETYVSA